LVIGVLTLELFIGEASSLKDKRRVLKSLLDRTRLRFNVAVAEVGKQDAWRHATVGVSCVTNNRAHAHRIMASVLKYIEADGTVEIMEIQTELL